MKDLYACAENVIETLQLQGLCRQLASRGAIAQIVGRVGSEGMPRIEYDDPAGHNLHAAYSMFHMLANVMLYAFVHVL